MCKKHKLIAYAQCGSVHYISTPHSKNPIPVLQRIEATSTHPPSIHLVQPSETRDEVRPLHGELEALKGSLHSRSELLVLGLRLVVLLVGHHKLETVVYSFSDDLSFYHDEQ